MRRLVLAAVVLLVSCKTGNKVTEQTCADWVDQYEKISKKALAPTLEKCHMSSKENQGSRTMLVEMCKHNIGLAYDEAQAKCFMSAKNEDDWKACDFKADTAFYGFASGIDGEREMLEKICKK